MIVMIGVRAARMILMSQSHETPGFGSLKAVLSVSAFVRAISFLLSVPPHEGEPSGIGPTATPLIGPYRKAEKPHSSDDNAYIGKVNIGKND